MSFLRTVHHALPASGDFLPEAPCPFRPQGHPGGVHDPPERAERAVRFDHRQRHQPDTVIKIAIRREARHERVLLTGTVVDGLGLEQCLSILLV